MFTPECNLYIHMYDMENLQWVGTRPYGKHQLEVQLLLHMFIGFNAFVFICYQ